MSKEHSQIVDRTRRLVAGRTRRNFLITAATIGASLVAALTAVALSETAESDQPQSSPPKSSRGRERFELTRLR